MAIDIENSKLNSPTDQEINQRRYSRIASLAGALIVENLPFITGAYIILLVPHLTLVWASTARPELVALLLPLIHLFDLLFMLGITLRGFKLLGRKIKLSLSTITHFLGIGFFQWILYALPLRLAVPILSSNAEAPLILPLFIFIATPLLFLSLRLLLFPVPTLVHSLSSPTTRSLKGIIYHTLQYSSIDRWLPLKILAPPLAISIFLSAIPLLFSPDGRIPSVYYLSAALEMSLWIFLSFLSVSAGFTLLSETEWRKCGLDHYREDRFNTIAVKTPRYIVNILKPAFALKLIAISFLLWSINLIRLQTLPPAPTINIEKIRVFDNQLTLIVNLHDEKYRFRGFVPAAFRIAGAKGTVLAAIPEKVIDTETKEDLFLGISSSTDSLTAAITFQTDRPAEKLVLLEDLILYYRNFQVSPLQLSKDQIQNE